MKKLKIVIFSLIISLLYICNTYADEINFKQWQKKYEWKADKMSKSLFDYSNWSKYGTVMPNSIEEDKCPKVVLVFAQCSKGTQLTLEIPCRDWNSNWAMDNKSGMNILEAYKNYMKERGTNVYLKFWDHSKASNGQNDLSIEKDAYFFTGCLIVGGSFYTDKYDSLVKDKKLIVINNTDSTTVQAVFSSMLQDDRYYGKDYNPADYIYILDYDIVYTGDKGSLSPGYTELKDGSAYLLFNTSKMYKNDKGYLYIEKNGLSTSKNFTNRVKFLDWLVKLASNVTVVSKVGDMITSDNMRREMKEVTTKLKDEEEVFEAICKMYDYDNIKSKVKNYIKDETLLTKKSIVYTKNSSWLNKMPWANGNDPITVRYPDNIGLKQKVKSLYIFDRQSTNRRSTGGSDDKELNYTAEDTITNEQFQAWVMGYAEYDNGIKVDESKCRIIEDGVKYKDKISNDKMSLYIGMCIAYGFNFTNIYEEADLEKTTDKGKQKSVSNAIKNLNAASSFALSYGFFPKRYTEVNQVEEKTLQSNVGKTSVTYDASLTDIDLYYVLGCTLSSLTSFADNDYQLKMVSYLPYTRTGALTSNRFSNDESYNRILKAVIKAFNYRKVIVSSNTNNSRLLNTKNLQAMTLSDILDGNLCGYVSDEIYNTDKYLDGYNASKLVLDYLDTNKKEVTVEKEVIIERKDIRKETKKETVEAEEDILDIVNSSIVSDEPCKQEILAAKINCSLNSNMILNIDKYGYKNNNILGYINYLYFNQIKNNLALLARVDLSSPVYCDAFGNIISSENIMIFPAVSNDTILSQANADFMCLFYNSKCFCDAFSTAIEIDNDAYFPLDNYFKLASIDDSDALTTYNIYSKFKVLRNKNKTYLYLAQEDYTFADSKIRDMQEIIYNRYTYNANSISDQIDNVFAYLICKQHRDKMTFNTKDGSIKDIKINKVSNKEEPYAYFKDKLPIIQKCVFTGTEYCEYLDYQRHAFDMVNYSMPKLLIGSTFDDMNLMLSKTSFKYLTNFNLNELPAELIHIILLIVVFGGLIVTIIMIIARMDLQKIKKEGIVFALAVFLVISTPWLLGKISSISQMIVLGNMADRFALTDIIEAKKNKLAVKSKVSGSTNTLIALEENNIPIMKGLYSILKLDKDYTIKSVIDEEAALNPLTGSSNEIDRYNGRYYLNLKQVAANIGVRSTTTGLALTYTNDESVINYYTLTLPLMQGMVDRMNNLITKKKLNIHSNLDYSSDIDNFNNSYGITFDFIEEVNNNYKTLNYEEDGIKVEQEYDASGIYSIVDSLTNNDTFGNPLKDTYVSVISTDDKIGTIDSQTITTKFQSGITNVYDGMLRNKKDITYAAKAANDRFIKELQYVSTLATSAEDRQIILYLALVTSLEFNKQIGLPQNRVLLDRVDNSTVSLLSIFGFDTMSKLTSRTASRFLFDNTETALQYLLTFLYYIIFEVASSVKQVTLLVSIAVFIIALIKTGISRNNIEGYLSCLLAVVIIQLASLVIFYLAATIASIVNNLYISTVVSIVLYAAFTLLMLKAVVTIVKDYLNAGRAILDKVMQPVMTFVNNVTPVVGGAVQQATNQIGYMKELALSETTGVTNAVSEDVKMIAEKYNGGLIENALHDTEVIEGIFTEVDNG